MSDHLDIGFRGELLASTHLEREGYTILEKNWRQGRLEIDIICKKEGVLVFVEVKTRSSSHLGDPLDSISRKKQGFIIRAADAYVKELEDDPELRFDVIGIVLTKNNHQLVHVEDAFYPSL